MKEVLFATLSRPTQDGAGGTVPERETLRVERHWIDKQERRGHLRRLREVFWACPNGVEVPTLTLNLLEELCLVWHNSVVLRTS